MGFAPQWSSPLQLASPQELAPLNPVAFANTKVKARRALLETLDWAIEEVQRNPF